MALPEIISAILAWVPGPLPRNVPPVHLPVSSRKATASPSILLRRITIIIAYSSFLDRGNIECPPYNESGELTE
jgi:hypothetical protein